MKSPQFLLKSSYLMALGELTGGNDILQKADFLIVQRRAGMRNGYFLFHCTCQIRCL